MGTSVTVRTLEAVSILLDQLREAPWNANRVDDETLEKLRRSLRRFGVVENLVVRQLGRGKASAFEVISGNHRLRLYRDEGLAAAPCVVVKVSDGEARVLAQVLNRTRGADDPDAYRRLLVEALAELEREDVLELLPETDESLAEILGEFGDDGDLPDDGPDPDDEPELPKQPRSKLGELYELGPHRLLCGDATIAEHVAELMAGERADAVFMDPPYAIYGSSSGLSESVTDDKIVRPFFRDALAMCQAHIKLFGHVYVCCDWRSWPSWWEVSKLTQLAPKNLLVWDKGGAGLGNNWANTHELIGFFTLMPEQKTMSGARRTGQRQVLQANVIRANRVTGRERQHNAAKPVDLIETVIAAATDAGELVLDLFGGSGSTLVAADRIGRRAFLMEIDPAYCDVIRQRYAALVDDASFAP